MPADGTLEGGGLVLHVRGYFWKSYSQVIRASPGCYEVCPRLVVSPHPDLCKRVGRCTQCVLTQAPAVLAYAFSVGTWNSKIFRGKEQKNKNSKAKKVPLIRKDGMTMMGTMGATITGDLLFNGMMWSAPG